LFVLFFIYYRMSSSSDSFVKQLNEGVIKKESVQTVAEACSIPAIECSAEEVLASDTEFRIRMLIEEAKKFAIHSKRWRPTSANPSGGSFLLTSTDIQSALAVLHEDPIFGHNPAQGEEPKFLKLDLENQTLFYADDEVLPLSEVVNDSLPPYPSEIFVTQHWLAVEGVQPAIPQNPLPKPPAQRRGDTSSTSKSNNLLIEQRPRVAHVLSQEMQLFFQTIVDGVRGISGEGFEQTLRAVKSDPSVAQLLPYIIKFIADEVSLNLRNLPLLTRVMKLADALVDTRTLFLQPYLHQLLPAVLTCVVGKQLCADPTSIESEGHWELRDNAAKIVEKICKKYPSNQQSLEGRVVKTLFHALMDPEKPSSTHYGAIVCLATLGQPVLELLVRNMRFLYDEIVSARIEENDKDSLEHKEAERVNNALFRSAKMYITHVISPSEKPLWDPNIPRGKIIIRDVRKLYSIWESSILVLIPPDLQHFITGPLEGFDDADDDDEDCEDESESGEESDEQQQQPKI